MKDNEPKKPSIPARRSDERRRKINENYNKDYSPEQMRRIIEQSHTTRPEKKEED